MSALLRKVQTFIRSPRGQRLTGRARREVTKPGQRRRFQRLRHRFTGHRS